MNIRITRKTSTQIEVNTPGYYENTRDGYFAAIIGTNFVTGWMADNINYATIRTEQIKEGEELNEVTSQLAQVLTSPEWVPIDRERYVELFSACLTKITLNAQEVQP